MFTSRLKITVCITLSLWASSTAAETLHAAQTAWPPFIMDSPIGKGIAHDMVVNALTSSGYTVQFTQKPWARILKETIKGKNDVIIAIWKTEEREKTFLFTQPYMYNQMAVVSLRKSNFKFKSLESFKDKRIALINGYAYAGSLLEYDQMEPVISIDLPNSIRLVLTERADALVTDEVVGEWTITEMGIDRGQLVFSDVYLDSTPLYAAVRKSHPQAEQIVEILNKYFDQQAAQELQRLKTRYGLNSKR